MTTKEFLLELASKFKPIQVKQNIPIDKLNITMNIGNKEYNVVNGELLLGEGPESKVQLIKDGKGFLRPQIKNTEIEGFSDNKKENIEMLDSEGKIFTRSDIGEPQLELLNVSEDHENIIKTLKPILQFHRSGSDIGALLAASAIIKVEDERKNIDLSKRMHGEHATCYKKRGAMIYNLFRSEILQREVLDFLDKLKKGYFILDDIKMNFLIYWDSILDKGYPTAYFVSIEDNKDSLYAEIEWRFEKGVNYIDVYSRGSQRNKNAEKWCKQFAKDNNCSFEKSSKYQLGFTLAMKFKIKRNPAA